jgi:hypothetical protein
MTSPALLAEATGAPGTSCSDSAALSAHTSPSTVIPPAERRRCRVVTVPTRTADAVTRATTSTTAHSARTSARTVPAVPIDSRTTEIAGPRLPQSRTGSKGRASTS